MMDDADNNTVMEMDATATPADASATAPTPAAIPVQEVRHLFVVQKCWFSGPHIFDPVDYARLFFCRASAETLAYQSAHAHAAAAARNADKKVRTIQLQQHASINPVSNSPYGFIAAGALFWIRSIKVGIVGAAPDMANNNEHQHYYHNNMAHVIMGPKQTLWSAVGQNRVAQQQVAASATAPITAFCGSSTAAAAAAHQAARQLPDCGNTTTTTGHCGVRVAQWPLGPPPAHGWWKEWETTTTTTTITGNNNTTTSSSPFEHYQQQQCASSSSKRTAAAAATRATVDNNNNSNNASPVLLSWNSLMESQKAGGSTTEEDDSMMTTMQGDHYLRPTKRRTINN